MAARMSTSMGCRILAGASALLSATALCVALATPVGASETPTDYQTIAYERAPQPVSLPVGTERFITFPSPVQFGLPPALTAKLRLQTVGDTVYLKALEPFETTRAAVRGIQDGRIYLLDLTASPAADDRRPIRVVAASGGGSEPGSTAAGPAGDDAAPAVPARAREQKPRPPDVGYLELTRFAAQQIYAPPRLAPALPGVTPVPLPRIPPTTQLVRGGGFEALPIASWRAGNGLQVTAVMLRNQLPRGQTWDPRLMRGTWRTAACIDAVVGPRGGGSDTTAVFLVHDGSFAEAARPWLD